MSNSEKPMKNEEVFNKEGFYKYVVKWNAIMHQEAIELGKKILAEWIQKRNSKSPVRVLDLACGGKPITITAMMNHCKDQVFTYTGIDINRDQINNAQNDFVFPNNAIHVELYEGDAWNLDELPIVGYYDIVFIGLNFHHGTPEELYCVGKQIYNRMERGGLLINHDIYRPDNLAYLSRPNRNPDNADETLELISVDRMESCGIQSFRSCVEESPNGAPDWRTGFIKELHNYLRSMGGSEKDVCRNMEHIWRRDYPVSTREIAKILSQTSLRTTVYRYERTLHPLQRYFAMVTASKGEGI